jgi:hypothetical protein
MLLFFCGVEHHFHKRFPTAASAQHIHTQRPDSVGIMLGVATAYADDGIGIFLAASADYCPIFLIGHCGDGTGVDNVAIAFLIKSCDFVAFCHKKLFHCLGFVLVCLASKGIKSKLHLLFPPISKADLCKYHPKSELKTSLASAIILRQ